MVKGESFDSRLPFCPFHQSVEGKKTILVPSNTARSRCLNKRRYHLQVRGTNYYRESSADVRLWIFETVDDKQGENRHDETGGDDLLENEKTKLETD